MAYLIAQVWGLLLSAALFGGVAGWFWHARRLAPRFAALRAERRALRSELLELAVGGRSPSASGLFTPNAQAYRIRIAELERALAEARGRGAEADVLRLRVAELERAGGPARPVAALDVTEYTDRIAALQQEVEAARAAARAAAEAAEPQTPIAALEAEPDPALKWRLRYFERRTAVLEAAAEVAPALPPPAEPAPEPAPTPEPAQEDELTLIRWRNRYLTARVAYLEAASRAEMRAAEPAPTPIPVPVPETEEDREAQARARWRTLYLERRAGVLTQDAEGLRARIEDLERLLAEARAEGVKAAEAGVRLADAEDDLIRARWKGRYLEARVRHLETVLSERLNAERAAPPEAKPAPALVPAPVEPAPPKAEPAAAAGPLRLERPSALSAPRAGAPDDLRLIEGVPPQAESTLNALGVYHFDQIAAWSEANIAWVDQYLNLRGRIVREQWIAQARALMQGAGGEAGRRYAEIQPS